MERFETAFQFWGIDIPKSELPGSSLNSKSVGLTSGEFKLFRASGSNTTPGAMEEPAVTPAAMHDDEDDEVYDLAAKMSELTI